jgi:hypothetical protein
VVELGKYRLKFVGDAPVPAAAVEKADFEKTMVLRPSAMKAAAEQARAMGAGGAEAARAAAAQQVAASAAAAGTAEKAPAHEKTPAMQATTPTPVPPPAPAPAAPPAPAAAPPAAAAPKSAHPLGAIQILSGANAGKELELAKPLTTLGKPGVQVAVLTRRPQGYFITHVEGANPPQVNGAAIGTAPHALKDHDVVELAGVKMEFFLKG